MNRSTICMVLAVALLQPGCVWYGKKPDLTALYSRSAQSHDLERNAVIVIPGLMGSMLEAGGGPAVWGTFIGRNANPKKPEGARLVALPMRRGVPLRELHDEVLATGVLNRIQIKILGIPLRLGAYSRIMTMLGVGGYRDEQLALSGAVDYGDAHFTCFQFAYDWRRDLSEAAARLATFIDEKRAYIREEQQRRFGEADPDIRFDIVAHSLGGLVTRYYLRYGGAPLPDDGSLPELTWAGAANVDRVILIAPPNAGATDAIRNLVRGVKLAPTLPRYDPVVLSTMPSSYQALPRGRHRVLVDAADPDTHFEDLHDPALWRELGWGLAAPDADEVLQLLLPDVDSAIERREIALDHLDKSLRRGRQFVEALDLPASPPDGVTLHLVAGDSEPTSARVAVDRTTGEIRTIEKAPGDGTVLRSSALMDERLTGDWRPDLVSPIDWHDVNFIFRSHLGMTKDPNFADNVLFMLLER